MYKEVKGDLIKMAKNGKFDIICHGANCMSIMNAGIALEIKNNFIDAYDEDQVDLRRPTSKLGDLSYIHDDETDTYIVNLYTQLNPGKNIDYTALRLCLRKITYNFESDLRIGLPLIGCGIGGGKWEIVKNIIKEELQNYNVTVVIYNK